MHSSPRSSSLPVRLAAFLLPAGLMALDLLPVWYPGDPHLPGLWLRGALLAAAGVYLAWRAGQKARLPRLGIETGVILFLLAVLAALAASPEPRLGLAVLASLLRYLLLFYLLLDMLGTHLPRHAVVDAMLLLSGFLLVLAMLETYAAYLGFWSAAGTRSVLPPFTYRFRSLLTHSNAMMAYLNLMAPLALVRFLQEKRFSRRVLLGVWLAFFLLAIPFSSSRSSWLGTAAWMGVLALYWLSRWGLRQRLQRIPRPLLAGLAVVALILLAGGGLLGVRFISVFGAHPTHGGNPFGGRAGIWLPAVEFWSESPVLGVGPGRTGLAYFSTTDSIPPQFWPFHAHMLYLYALTEFGLLGLLAFALLLGFAGASVWRMARQAAPQHRLLYFGMLAALAAYLVQSVFDVLTIWIAVNDQLVVLLALFFTSLPLARTRRAPLALLGLPLLLFAAWFGYSAWSAAPMRLAALAARSGDWSNALAQMETARQRDPALRYYGDMASIGAAWSARETASAALRDALLHQAIAGWQYTADTPHSANLLLAEMAVLEWQAGLPAEALDHLQSAIGRAPLESSFWVNLGAMLEQSGQEEDALAAYCQALILRPVLAYGPSLAPHPFWATTPLRQRALQQCEIPAVESLPFWLQARQAVEHGDLTAGRIHLAESGWANESVLARKIAHGLLLEAQGDLDGAMAEYARALAWVAVPRLETGRDFAVDYASYFKRSDLPADLVPGYVQLQKDVGQFEAMQKLMDFYGSRGEDEKQALVEALYQAAARGELVYPQVTLP